MEKINPSLNIPPLGMGTLPLAPVDQNLLNNNIGILRLFGRAVNKFYLTCQGCKLTSNIVDALKMGYRLIDTSRAYGVEKWIGKAIRKSAVPREQIFITTRISNREQYSGTVREAVLDSLRLLQTDYIDLYMLHWPVKEHFVDSWKILEDFHARGKIKHLGVANFHQHHLEQLQAQTTIRPVVNQVEIHPLFSQKELIKYCHSQGITVEAYTPLGRFDLRIAQNSYLLSLAEKYNKTVAQIVLRWHIQNSVIPVPHSSRHQGLLENIDVFDFVLTDEEMHGVDCINQNVRLRFDPDSADMRKL